MKHLKIINKQNKNEKKKNENKEIQYFIHRCIL